MILKKRFLKVKLPEISIIKKIKNIIKVRPQIQHLKTVNNKMTESLHE